MRTVLIQLQPFDITQNARIDVRVGDASEANDYGLGGVSWEPACKERPVLSIDTMSVDLGGSVVAGTASFELLLRNITSINLANRIYWQGAPVKIWTTDAATFENATLEFTGTITSAPLERDNMYLNVTCTVSTKKIEKDLLWKTYNGDGASGGTPELSGQPKPAGFGFCEGIPPVWIDVVDNIGQIDGYSNTLSITKLFEGGNDFGPKVADYANYAALKAAIAAGTVGPGQWATSVADGMIGLGAPPAGIIGVNATFGGAAPGDFARNIVQYYAGVDVSEIDTASFAYLNTAVPYPMHYWTDSQVQVNELLQVIAADCNATPLITFQNKVSITRAVTTSPVGTLDRSGSIEPRVLNWKSKDAETPFYEIKSRAARPINVLALNEVLYASDLIDRGLWNSSTSYLQGDIVNLADGSRWLYINVASAAGIAPGSPGSEAYWSAMSPPTEAQWDLVTGPGKPQDNATVGAPAGTYVASVLAEDVIAGLNEALLYGPDIEAIRESIDAVFAAFVPDTFEADGQFWQESNSGAPEDGVSIAADAVYSFPSETGIGKVGQMVPDMANARRFNTINVLRVKPNRKYRLIVRMKHTGTVIGTPNVDIKILTLDDAYTVVGASVVQNCPTTTDYTDYQIMVDGTAAAASGAVWLRASAETEAVGNTYRFQNITMDDVTESEAARGQATIATTQATAATAAASAALVTYDLIANVSNRPNLLPNASGENGVVGWSRAFVSGIYQAVNAWGPHIQTAGWSGTYAVIISPRAPVFAGQVYTFSGEIETFGTPGPTASSMQAVFFDGSGTQLSFTNGPALSGSQGYSNDGSNRLARAFQATAPAGAMSVEIRCYSSYSAPSDIVTFSCRQLKVEQGAMPPTLYNNTAQVTQTAGVVASQAGKLAAYWRVTAVASGRAQLTVYADANGGAGVDVVGDFRVSGNALIVGTIVANRFLTNAGVDLAAIVPSSLNTAAYTNGGGTNMPISLNSPNTLGPNGNGQYVLAATWITTTSFGDGLFFNATVVCANGTNRGNIYLQYSYDNANWANATTATTVPGRFGTATGQSTPAGTFTLSGEEVGHNAGTTVYFRILGTQRANQSFGDGTAGTNWTVTSATILLRRFFSK